MLNVSNISGNYCTNFKGANRYLSNSLEHNHEMFKNKIIADEFAINDYLAPEVKIAIEDKIQGLSARAKNINSKDVPSLVKPLQDAIKNHVDITQTYIALVEFEKKLSEIRV